jgi:hypothetical protein
MDATFTTGKELQKMDPVLDNYHLMITNRLYLGNEGWQVKFIGIYNSVGPALGGTNV